MNRPRLAFTLVELLVTFGIIAILIAVSMPAIMRVRESAARTRCAHQMKQLGLAMHNYHTVHKTLPPACLTSSMFGPGPIVFFLAYLDPGSVSEGYDAQGRSGATGGLVSNDVAGAVRIPILSCPSDPHDPRDYQFGWTNYHTNYGTWVSVKGWDGMFGPNFDVAGAKRTGPIQFRDIRDGLSNTAAFAEVANGRGYDGSAPKHARVDCFEFGPLVASSLGQARTALMAKDWRTASIADPTAQEPWRWRGYPWREGTIWRTGYNHILPPNRACWRCNNDWWQVVSPASSFHPGGVNTLMGDASVRFVNDSVDPDVWAALGTRAGEETLVLD